MKRITLRATFRTGDGDYQPGASLAVEDPKADELIKAGKATLSPQQVIYTHEDQMPPSIREKALRALEAADAAAGINNQVARAAATERFRK